MGTDKGDMNPGPYPESDPNATRYLPSQEGYKPQGNVASHARYGAGSHVRGRFVLGIVLAMGLFLAFGHSFDRQGNGRGFMAPPAFAAHRLPKSPPPILEPTQPEMPDVSNVPDSPANLASPKAPQVSLYLPSPKEFGPSPFASFLGKVWPIGLVLLGAYLLLKRSRGSLMS